MLSNKHKVEIYFYKYWNKYFLFGMDKILMCLKSRGIWIEN